MFTVIYCFISGVVVAEKNRKPRNPRSRNSSKPSVEKATDEGSNYPEQVI
jgi:hypothetical protein